MIIKAKTDQAFYKTRQKVTLDMEIVNPDGTPAEANLLLSLAREGLLDEAVEHHRGDNFRQQEISEPGFPPEWGGMWGKSLSRLPAASPLW